MNYNKLILILDDCKNNIDNAYIKELEDLNDNNYYLSCISSYISDIIRNETVDTSIILISNIIKKIKILINKNILLKQITGVLINKWIYINKSEYLLKIIKENDFIKYYFYDYVAEYLSITDSVLMLKEVCDHICNSFDERVFEHFSLLERISSTTLNREYSFIESIPFEIRYELLIKDYSKKYYFDLIPQINLGFFFYFKNRLNDDDALCKEIVEGNIDIYCLFDDSLTTKCFLSRSDCMPKTIDFIFNKINSDIGNDSNRANIFFQLNGHYNTKKLFKALIATKEEFYINEFINLNINNEEIKRLIAFC